MKRAGTAWLVVCAALTAASQGFGQAQGPSEVPETNRAMTDKARELYTEGRTLYGRNEWDKAHASFLAAWSLKNHWQIAGMLGLCELKMGRFRDAAEHLAFSIRTGSDSVSAEEMNKLSESLEEAKRKVAMITVQVDTDGAEVQINGRKVGSAPLLNPLFVDPGKLALRALTGERSSPEIKVQIVAGEMKDIVLRVDRDAPAGQSDVRAGARVSEGGAREADVAGDAGNGPTYPVLFVSTTTVFLVGTVVGAIYWNEASANADDLKDLRASLPLNACNDPSNAQRCDALQTARDDHDSNRQKRDIGFIVGGVGLVAAGVAGYLWMSEKNLSKSQETGQRNVLSALPFSNGQAAGIAAAGTF